MDGARVWDAASKKRQKAEMAKRVEVDKGERVDHWVEPVKKKERQGREEKRNMGKGERLIAHGLCHREDRRDCYRKEDFLVGGACDEVGFFVERGSWVEKTEGLGTEKADH